MARYRVTTGWGVNIRTAPTTAAQRIGALMTKTEFDDVRQINDSAGNVWHVIEASAGGAVIRDPNVNAPAYLYAAHFHSGEKLTDLVSAPQPVPPTPPPAPSSKPFLGVNCITDVGAAKDAIALGAPAVLVMGQKQEAVWLAQANPNVRVIYRCVKPLHNPSVDWMLSALAPNASDPPIVFMGRNENDEGLGVSPGDILQRAAFDVEVAKRIKAIQPNATYIAGTFSMGTPALERDDVALAMRNGYRDAYNSGLLGMDFHLYAPTPAQIWQDPELIWYERRWEMLFTRCGFDPMVRNVWATETGLDQGSVGGFVAHGFTDADLSKFLTRYQEIQSRRVRVDGTDFPSQYVGGVLFQYGAEPNWRGYDMRGYRNALKAFWAA